MPEAANGAPMLVRATVCTVAILGCAGAAAAQNVPDSATIRSHMLAARGTIHTVFRESLIVETDTLPRTEHMFRRGADWREVSDSGPFHSERGVNKGQAWHQNDNGQTVLEQPQPIAEAPEPTTTSVQRVHEPIDAYVIATLTARGYGTKDYVDPSTWLLVRREVVTANGTTTTTFEDFRPESGETFAHAWRTEDGRTHTTSRTSISAYELGPVTDADLAIPTPRRALVELTGGNSVVTLPATFEPAHVAVMVTINGKGYDFVLDTGSSGITIDPKAAAELGLAEYGAHSQVTAQRYTTARTIVPEMKIGDVLMRNVAVQIVPLDVNTAYGVREIGLLGFDFLAEHGIVIDYEHKKVTLSAGDLAIPEDPNRVDLDVRLGTQVPMTDVWVNGALGERWIFDTGAAGSFLIFDYFARRHPDAVRDEGADPGAYRVRLRGIGGAFDTRPYRISSVRVGKITFKNFTGYRVLQKGAYEGATDGLIGPEFFHYFTVYVDYANSRISLVPNSTGRRAIGVR